MLQLKNITKDYKIGNEKVHALRGVSIDFRESEFVSVLGQSGCGKTTLLNIIGGLDRYTDGDLIIGGKSTKEFKSADWDTYRNHSIGFVFQSFNLIDELNVYENVELPLTYLGFKASERRRMVEDILKRMNISHRAKHFPQQLSGGQQQRVAIARAVVTNPKLILADEPTGNLDSKNGAEVMNLLTELNKEGTTIIMVTHSQHDASFAHRTVHLFDGSLVASVIA